MLVNLISAIQFISSIDANCLTINPLDYQMYVRCLCFIVGCIPRRRSVFGSKEGVAFPFSRVFVGSCLVDEGDVDTHRNEEWLTIRGNEESLTRKKRKNSPTLTNMTKYHRNSNEEKAPKYSSSWRRSERCRSKELEPSPRSSRRRLNS